MSFARGILLSLIVSTFAFTSGCTSKQSSSETPSSEGTKGVQAVPSASIVLTEVQILDRYNLMEMNAAANALRVILDQSLSAPKEIMEEPALANCRVTGDDAKKMLMPLKALIDIQESNERDAYILDSDQYSKTHALDSCAAQCACGTMLSVLEPVDAKALRKAKDKAQHRRFLKHLEAKASRQSAEESETCARKAIWFCTSDLRDYLEREARKNAQ
jgi:hypothetical protein